MLLLIFIFLQAMDALTTVVFLHLGVTEANPLIRMALSRSAEYPLGPALALAGPKLFAVMLGLYAWRSGRKGVLVKMNILFTVAVAGT